MSKIARSAWFMSHRLREAMSMPSEGPIGDGGGVVEIDETFIGKKEGVSMRRGYAHKRAILTLITRKGSARSFHVDGTSAKHLLPIIKANVAPDARIMTDEAGQYAHLNKHFASHDVVRHGADEYVRGEAHTNTVEGYYSVFKRGMKGIYQHCSEKHLHRYVTEFDFRYNDRVALGVDDEGRFPTRSRASLGSASLIGGLTSKRLKREAPKPRQPEPVQLRLPGILDD